MPPRRRPNRHSQKAKPNQRGRIIAPNNRSKGVVSTILAFVFWTISCVAIWLITKYQLEHNVYKLLGVVDLMGRDVVYNTGKSLAVGATITPESLSMASKEIVNKLCLYRTLILGIVELALMIWPMLEYWFSFRKEKGLRTSYKWYVPVVIMCIIGLIAIVIADAIVLALGWITLVSLLVLLAVIFVPRVTTSLQPT